MARIFLSHSSKNDAAAIALRDWIIAGGWDDHPFLDLDPERGIAAGERWERALYEAAGRCETVLFLVSRDWLKSDWCLKEFNLAQGLNKRLFGVLIDDLPLSDLPASLTTVWQVVNLASGHDHEIFRTVLPDLSKEEHVHFSRSGLARLKAGLDKAGLDPRFFAWPPEDERNPAPYPGLRPLEAEDAGIFFGREAPTIFALDRLRGLREAAPPRLLVIQGASGTGKSSFLRAGVIPRLTRDDENFLPLPIIRPETAVITGKSGLIQSLEEAFRVHGPPRNRADIATTVNAGAAELLPLLAGLAEKARAPDISGEARLPPPSLVLSIDQAEELFFAEGAEEARTFLALLKDLVLASAPNLIVLFTIRSDSYERLQTAKALDGIRQEIFGLPPVPRGAYQIIIEGPAQRLKGSKRELKIEPALTQALLTDIDAGGGKDALPLLAFTLERLYREYGAEGDLRLKEYDALDRIGGSIQAAVEAALKAADSDPTIPKDLSTRLALLRRALIPALAGIDPKTREPRRRVARISEIPQEARGLINCLVEARLLATDSLPGTGETTIEPAHEALLRQWNVLRGWLKEDSSALLMLEGVQQAARDWAAKDRSGDWLSHSAGRLEDAEGLRRREDFARFITPIEQAYLEACRAQENARRNREIEEARKLAEERKKTAQRTRIWAIVASVLAVGAIGGAGVAFIEFKKAEKELHHAQTEQSRFLADLARQWTEDDDPTTGMLLALEGLRDEHSSEPEQRQRPIVYEAESAAYGAMWQARELAIAGSNPGGTLSERAVAFSPDGTKLVAIGADSKTARVSSVATGAEIATLEMGGSNSLLDGVAFSPDGFRLVTASYDNTARIWDAKTGKQIKVLHHQKTVNSAAYSSDGTRILTASWDLTARLWNAQSGEPIAILNAYESDSGLHANAAFSPDGNRIITWAPEENSPQIWDGKTGELIAKLDGHTRGVTCIAFSPDGTLLVTGAGSGNNDFDHTARLWDAKTGKGLAILEGQEHGVRSVSFSPDGSLIVATDDDNKAMLWDIAKAVELAKAAQATEAIHLSPAHVLGPDAGWVVDANFGPDGTCVVIASEDHTASVWDAKTGEKRVDFKGHQGPVNSARFSPDGNFVVTAAGSERDDPKDNTARLWDAYTGAQLAVLKGHDDAVESASFSPDGKRVVTIGSRSSSSDNTVRLWDASAGGPVTILRSNDHDVERAAFNSGGTRILTVGYFTADLWNAKNGAVVAVLKNDIDLHCVASFSPNGTRVITATSEAVSLWDAETGVKVATFNSQKGEYRSEHPSPAAFSLDGKLLVTASGEAAQVRDAKTGKQLRVLAGQDQINSIGFSPDSKLVITAASSEAWVWDADTGVQLGVLKGHKGKIQSASFSSDGTRIVTVASDGTRLWNAETQTQIALLNDAQDSSALFSPDGKEVITGARGHDAELWDAKTGVKIADFENHRGLVDDGGVAFSPDGTHLAISEEKTASVWDIRTHPPKPVAGLVGHDGLIRHVVFSPDVSPDAVDLFQKLRGLLGFGVGHASPDGKRVATSASDNTARLWDAQTGDQIAALSGQSVAFSPDGKWVLTTSENMARLWLAFPNLQGLVDHIKKSAPRCLMPKERENAYLDPAPPRWCSQAWTDWLNAKDAGKNPQLPN
jgi:WD40 repeat protein